MNMPVRKKAIYTLLVLGLLVALLDIQSVLANPSDPFSGSTPTFDAAPEEATKYNSGDWGISEQNGAAIYTFPIGVPPGRNGMAPSLALRYSSNSSLRGGLAVGWTFDLPAIDLDHALGVAGGEHYKASLGSAAGRIIGNKVQFDTSNTLFHRFDPDSIEPGPHHWVALTTDGVRHYFEEVASELVNGHRVDTKWRVTRQVDPFGNTVLYDWTHITAPNGSHVIDQSLQRIEYSANDEAGLLPHAKIEFEYAALDVCNDSNVPIGAAMRKGSQQVDGAQKLTAVKTYVRDAQDSNWRLSKEVMLTYILKNSVLDDRPLVNAPLRSTESTAFNCSQSFLRYLTQIDVTAYAADGTASSVPPIQFQYNHRINETHLAPGPQPVGSMLREITIDSPGHGQAGISGRSVGGAQHTLLDIDNDGVRDYVSIIEEDASCKLLWRKGLYGGGFEEQARKAHLPTAAWYREWRGLGRTLNTHPPEGCTLSGQIVYRSVPPTTPDSNDDGWAKGVVSYHFMDYTGDGRLDLLTNVWASNCHWTYDPWPPPIDGKYCSFGGGVQGISGGGNVPMTPERGNPLTAENDSDRYIWRVYPGTGNPDEPFINSRCIGRPTCPAFFRPIVKSPAPLPPAASDEQLDTSNSVKHGIPSLFDIDGDGFLDVIVTSRTDLTRSCHTGKVLLSKDCDWTVYFGTGTGTFPETADAYVWDVPEAQLHNGTGSSDVGTGWHGCGRNSTEVDLLDMNGDGLADLVVRLANGQMLYYRNTGSGFDHTLVAMNSASPLEQIQVVCTRGLPVQDLLNGERFYLRRLVDLDGDSLLDMVRFEIEQVDDETTVHQVSASFNLGDRFGESKPLLFPEAWAKTKRLLSAENGQWQLDTDFTDVTGDGLADLVQWQGNRLTYVSSPGLPFAPDLLRKVTNGRGMELSFFYAPSTDRNAVDWRATGSTLPHVTWVVKQVTVDGGLGTLPITTEYQYQTPNYLPIETKRSRFAGFTQNIKTVTATDGQSQQTRKTYSYAPDGSLVKTQTYHGGQLHRVTRQQWVHLGGGALPTLTTTCITGAANMSEADCFAQESHIQRVEKTWQIRSAGVIVNIQRIDGIGSSPGAADRHTFYDYVIRVSPGLLLEGAVPEEYWVQMRETLYETQDANGTFVMAGNSITDYDNVTGLPDKTRVRIDATTQAETDFGHDGQTGNLLSIQKPVQNAANGGSGLHTTYTYDSHKLFVYATTNELGHLVRTTYDVATGVLLKREGPNQIGSSQPIYDTEEWQVDGFGRVLEHAVSIDDEATGYLLHVVDKVSYFDFEMPNRVRVEQRRDFGIDDWVTTDRTADGLGRLLAETVHLNDGQVAETQYTYNKVGNLLAIDVPDPSIEGAQVQYDYEHDGLGRLLTFTRPDGSGLFITYTGLEKSIQEVTDDGSGAGKKHVYDVWGRLVALHELYPDAPAAVTHYTYDGHDNVSEIVDADGTVTELSHDWVGNRLAVTRGDRTWRYVYDRNGNLIEEVAPIPDGEAANLHTTHYQYDDLDRVISVDYMDLQIDSLPAPLEPTSIPTPSAAQITTTVQYLYDQGPNGVGRLSQVILPFGEIGYAYEARGLPSVEERSFNLDGLASISASQRVQRQYNALGQPTLSTWDDGQQWQIRYDERGLVDIVSWFDPASSSWQAVADYERVIACQPRVRNTDYDQVGQFSYDQLGRPLLETVLRPGHPDGDQAATRSYDYSDSGDLTSVSGDTAGVSAAASYTYDGQHRLRTASGPNGYQGTFTYSPAGNILTANVAWNGSTETRNVLYEYGALDPQAVDRLVTIDDNTAYADFAYDLSGNMVERTTPGGIWRLDWNGLDQIRIVQSLDGSEVYFYDHSGARMLAVNQTDGVRFWFAESETHYDLAGMQTRRYLHLSGGGPTLARVENGATIELQYADALQNLMFALDANGDVTASFLYGPFGEVVSADGAEEHRRPVQWQRE